MDSFDNKANKATTMEVKEMKQQKQFKYPIGGVPVHFPCKPYPTQLQMMSKIIQALSKGENALLESPTGSGKSLALLCSTLAWLKYQNDGNPEPLDDCSKVLENSVCCCSCHNNHNSHAVGGSNDSMGGTRVSIILDGNTIVSNVPGTNVVNATVVSNGPTARNTTMISNVSSTIAVPNTSSTKPIVTPQTPNVPPDSPLTPSTLVIPQQPNIVTLPNAISSFSQSYPQSMTMPLQPEFANILQQLQTQTCQIAMSAQNSSMKGSDQNNEPKSFDRVASAMQQGSSNVTFQNSVKQESKKHKDDSDFKSSKTKKSKQKRPKIEYEGEDEETNKSVSISDNIPTQQEIKINVEPNNGISPSIISKDAPNLAPPVMPPFTPCKMCGCGLPPPQAQQPARVRRIFYGTRTHRQIQQIIRELQKTEYSSIPMVILASREHTCIHPEVSRSKDKNEECKKLLDYAEGQSCSYFYKVQQKLSNQLRLKEYGLNTAWDIEDLVELGNKIKACPYFATRSLLEGAEIVFCPYNYLIDPKIRKQMLIDLKGQVLVLDEAHNMEDASRTAASLEVTDMQLNDIKEELSELMKFFKSSFKYGNRFESYNVIASLISNVISWMEVKSDNLPETRYEESIGIWNGTDFLPILKQLGISDHTRSIILNHLNLIFDDSHSNEEEPPPTPTLGTCNVLEAFFTVIGYVHTHVEDYRVALKKSTQIHSSKRRKSGGNQWKGRNREKVWMITLHFWCLNPAVAFTELNVARSIILTSGTLSPMSSFASELGTAFPVQLEANHVINRSQMWVHTLSHGPNGHPLNGSYQFSETFEFQDELGELILRVCEAVPYGVLCFLSSYKMMDKLIKRWQDNGLWYQLLKKKHIVYEPRAGDKEDFERVMFSFYDCIRRAVDGTLHQQEMDNSDICQDGAIFFAVCRGKVSEGLDFADHNARAVITVGIPFPSIMDKQISLKKEYNSDLCRKRGLLHGNEWYEIQAYRALNQAMGRCIRHKQDWGAIILVDARYGKGEKYTKGLSKWVRSQVRHQPQFSDAFFSLQSFVRGRMSNSPSKASTSLNHTMLEQSSMLNLSIKSESNSIPTLVPKPLVSFSFSPPLSMPQSHSSPVCQPLTTSVSAPLQLKNIPTSSSTSSLLINASSTHSNHNPAFNNESPTSPSLFGSEASRSPIEMNATLTDSLEQTLYVPNNIQSYDYHMSDDVITVIESPIAISVNQNLPTNEALLSSNNTLTKGQDNNGSSRIPKADNTTIPSVTSIACNNDSEATPFPDIQPAKVTTDTPTKVPTTIKTDTPTKVPITVKTDTPTKVPVIPTSNKIDMPIVDGATPTAGTTTTKPILRRSLRKRNTRMTTTDVGGRKKQARKKQSDDEDDFKLRTPRKKQKPKKQDESTLLSINNCNCGIFLNEEIEDITVCSLSSLFPDGDVSNSLLHSTLAVGDPHDRNVACVPRSAVTDVEQFRIKESSSLFSLNSIWDEVLGLCYSPWKCRCGQITGVEIFCSSQPDDSLVKKIIMKT